MSGFLHSFMKMRADLNAKQAAAVPIKGTSSIGAMPAPAEQPGVTLRGIIEEKPPAKVVLEYFRNRCEQLAESSDSDA